MRKLIGLLIGLSVSMLSLADDSTTIYLVRHGEKVDSTRQSDLTEIGKARAESFAKLLEKQNVTHVFSTPYVRTRNTALPTAQAHGLKIEEYEPDEGADLVETLKGLTGTILVTGHSNTVPDLVNLLTGENFDDLDERVYDKVYIVTLRSGVYHKLEIIHTRPRTPL